MIRRALLIALLASLLLSGCGESEPEDLAAAQPIEAGDSCHVCGMLIEEFPGPKGEAFLDSQGEALKFCSTMDLFAFLKQPENETRLSHAYVHDIGVPPWGEPSDEAFIRAEEAWYVVGHDRRGAMGHTLASFAEQADAETFRKAHGGELVAYEEIDLDLLGRLGRGELGGDGDEGMEDMPGHD
ncbi:nitrous oxide reductase accessory protein NosL [Halomonas rhizosphaerae]|uniref:Nitrous oxide reductase accessory protein NosL n=1 Tax=Halomonas rhizosphaerae TaxID=3043296 RepID=A0ABT6V3G3_9GAMM|nr:nitrous oxide reductase accessory protein NosL [Halomonas rhizosphaerae]MDI5892769.1 nitrous oxide reductase accessory protein NosL [Halomonas rhizosphaerae]